ncbi:M1 family metallopeptidase [Actinoplanes friuliensis]|uniref:Aminopeptidase N n=1 Tax=Actinoplanes friuliensis DSM 7358 TaxID=1246995 RepID=U5WAM6_9ACTN|nr:M1 family metallopeptidase [Actinoplanes friuliensis]AGZ45006.1 metallopeptidase [Actinoplanes friuliensis DSM 7358]
MRRKLLCAVLAGGLAITPGGPAGAAPARDYRPGSAGLGDVWYPLEGNGGYDVAHYDLSLSYDPGSGRLDGTARVDAVATQNLSRFDLDLQQLDVTRVLVDGRPASFRRDGQELVITPRRGIPARSRFQVAVTYGGVPQPLGGPTPYGFVRTGDGMVTLNVQDGASTWFPGNDHPSDKATFRFTITVPDGLDVVANGRRVSTRTHGGRTTHVWSETAPMATYLATVDVGRWRVRKGRTPGGIPEYVAVDPALGTGADDPMPQFWNRTAEVVDRWTQIFGPYPFDSTVAIVVLARHNGVQVPFSAETQTRPVYSAADSDEIIAHELAHQWFGDSVGITRWNEVWLSEGFAVFANWYFDELRGGTTVHDQARQVYQAHPADDPFWTIPLTGPDRPTDAAGERIYFGGALVLQMLRQELGDPTFFRVLRAWTRDHRHGTATTTDFMETATRTSGRDLAPFFRTWVYSPTRPALPDNAEQPRSSVAHDGAERQPFPRHRQSSSDAPSPGLHPEGTPPGRS